MKLLQSRDCEPQRGGKASLPANCVPGITPMLQLIRCITRKPSDKTVMSLIFANQVSSAASALSRKIMSHCLRPLRTHRAHAALCLRLWKGLQAGPLAARETESRPVFPFFLFVFLILSPQPTISTKLSFFNT